MPLAGRVAPSRVLFGPIETNLADGRALSPRHTAFYAARAVGGAGVIVTEIASVHESDWPYEPAPLASLCGPGWADVVRACRPYGTVVLAGLGHAGGQGSSAYHRRELWAPSPVADVDSREVPSAMEPAQVRAVVDGFAAASGTAVDAGCDGVELDAGQHSLLRQFLSGLTNLRTDGYGGGGAHGGGDGYAGGRARLLREVIAAVREVLGRDRVLGLRLCADELAPWAGLAPPAVSSLLLELAADLDYVVPVRGCALSVPATRPDLHTAPGFNRALCAGARTALRGSGSELPVVLQGSVVDVTMAAGALADGTADLVEMTRAQLAEPSLVALARAGTPERIRPCTLSNQHSRVRDPANLVISDEAEPDTCAPRSLAPATPADVLVVGGGPAGLEAARMAALRGHRVRLVDRAAGLGGGLRLAAALPGRARFGLLADWFAAELRRLGVEVCLRAPVGPAALAGFRADGWAVLLATGSRPGPVAYPVAEEGPALLSAAELVAGPVPGTGPAVVYDPVGDWTGVGVAELLAASGRPTTIVTPDPVVGVQLARTGGLVGANARLARCGVDRVTRTLLRARTQDGVALADRYTGARRELACSFVVDCGHRLPEDALDPAAELPRAGDCVAPRTVHEAVLEGRRLGESV